MEKQGNILSGMRPTGALHLGNYLGALENWVRLQDEYDCHFMVADWHALTSDYEDTSRFKENITQILIDWLAAGIDPEKSTIFIQSAVKEHAELHLLLGMTTPLSWLLRCPTYKDQLQQLKEKNLATYGFLGYPNLQAADIMMYKATAVPVGEDQLPHLELTREIVRRFNNMYGVEIFPEPKPLLTKAKMLPGLDGRKMSKSYGNAIALSDSPEEIGKKIMSMITDPARIRKDDPGHPEVCSVFSWHKMFNESEVEQIEADCRAGAIGCVACKRRLAEKVKAHMAPTYERRQYWSSHLDDVRDIVREGNRRASERAAKTLEEVRSVMKIDWN